MKDLEGKDVYLRPTGNHARGKGEKIYQAKIIKVARVFATFAIDGHRHEMKYRFSDHVLTGGGNFGYVVYSTLKEAEDYYTGQKLAQRISNKYRYQSDYAKISLEKLQQIANILNV